MQGFWDYYRENMTAMGYPVPDSFAGNFTLLLGTVTGIEGYITTYGPRVTVRDLVGAGLLKDRLLTIGALNGAFYLGCIVGSLAVAAGRVAGKGTSLADVIEYAVVKLRMANIQQLHRILVQNPRIYSRVRNMGSAWAIAH